MSYNPVAIYSMDGNFIGYGIKNDGISKLQSPNLYGENEQKKLSEQLGRLNENLDLTAVWPDARDPDVQRLLSDPLFMPIEMVEDEVVDDENSYYVYHQEPEYDILTGEPTGATSDGTIDREASVLVYKKMMIPARPSDVMERTKKACEIVARKRSGK